MKHQPTPPDPSAPVVRLLEPDSAERARLTAVLAGSGDLRAFPSAAELLADVRPFDVGCVVLLSDPPRARAAADLIARLAVEGPLLTAVALVASRDVAGAVEAMRAGATDAVEYAEPARIRVAVAKAVAASIARAASQADRN